MKMIHFRNNLTDIREKRYESQNRGIYMFRLDDERVVDATLTGGVARFVPSNLTFSLYFLYFLLGT